MKRLLLSIVLVLSGCSTLSPREFNPVEYDYSVKTTVSATRAVHLCGNTEYQAKFKQFIADLNENSMTLFEYERHLNGNDYSYVGATQVRQLVIDITVRNDYSDDYCVQKLSAIQSASRTLSRALGRLNSYNICDSDVTVKYKKYEELYRAGKLSQSEFKELSGDILKLQKVDKVGCSFENKQKFDEALDLISKAASLLPL